MFRQVLAGAFCTLAAIASAAAGEAPATSQEAPAAAESPPPVKKDPPIKLECKDDQITGSRIPRRNCAVRKPRDESAESRKPDEKQPEATGNQYNLGGR